MFAVLLSPMLVMERVALVAPATFPGVALLAPAGDKETEFRLSIGVLTTG